MMLLNYDITLLIILFYYTKMNIYIIVLYIRYNLTFKTMHNILYDMRDIFLLIS